MCGAWKSNGVGGWNEIGVFSSSAVAVTVVSL